MFRELLHNSWYNDRSRRLRQLRNYSGKAKEHARRMRSNGITLQQIANELDVSLQTVHRWTSKSAEATQILYKERNAEYIKKRKNAYMKKYRIDNPYQKKRQASERRDPESRIIRKKLRSRIRYAIKNNAKAANTAELLGCSVDELLRNWDQRYTVTWRLNKDLHIDHIRPCASFNLLDKRQQFVCFNWRNLQLLPAKDNIAKGDLWTKEMELQWIEMMLASGFEGDLFLVFN